MYESARPGPEFLGKLAPGAGTGRPAALSNLFPAGPRAVDPRPARRAIARNALRAAAGRPRARHPQRPTGWRRDAHRPRPAPGGQAAQLRPGTAGRKGPSPGPGPLSTGAGGSPSRCWRWPARYPRRAATSSWWSMPAMAARTPARSVARASAKRTWRWPSPACWRGGSTARKASRRAWCATATCSFRCASGRKWLGATTPTCSSRCTPTRRRD